MSTNELATTVSGAPTSGNPMSSRNMGQSWRLDEVWTPAALTMFAGVRCHNGGGDRTDSFDTAMFLRQLTYIMQTPFDIEYPELKGREIVPIVTESDPGEEFHLWHQMDRVGEAKILSPEAQDLPNIEVTGKEYGNRVYSIGASYQYTHMDVRRAIMSKIPLPDRKAKAARKAHEEILDRLLAQGANGLSGTPNLQASDLFPTYGLANFPTNLKGGVAGYTSVNWLDPATTVQQILTDVSAMEASMANQTLNIHRGNVLVLPTSLYNQLAYTRRSPTFTDDTLLQYIMKSSISIKKIIDWNQLNFAGKKQDTTTPGPRVMLLNQAAENFEFVMPQPFEQLPPQPRDLRFVIPTHSRYGGILVHQAGSILYLDGAGG